MAIKYFTSYSVRDKPIVSSCRDVTGPKHPYVTMNATPYQSLGIYVDLQIRHLWQLQAETIIDARVMGTYAKTYISLPINNVLEMQEK